MSKPKNPRMLDTTHNGVLFSNVTLRDLFAAAALQGMLANPDAAREARSITGHNPGISGEEAVVAHFAYQYADAMLRAREVADGE